MDAADVAQRLETLTNEYKRLYAEREKLEKRIITQFALLNGGIAKFLLPTESKKEGPRPLEDKLAISAGRAIVRALRAGVSREEIKRRAIVAATKLANKHGITALPTGVLAAIESRIKKRSEGFG